MRYADWTDHEWGALISRVRSEIPTQLSDSEIRECAWNYMQRGADGGGNRWGLEGTCIAMTVDSIHRDTNA